MNLTMLQGEALPPMTAAQQEKFDILLARIDHLPALPALALSLLQHDEKTDIDLPAVCARIQEDPALTLRVLKVANAPCYGIAGGVHDVDQAVVVLGSATLRLTVVTAALRGSLPVPRSQTFARGMFWRHALASGVVARRIAQALRIPPSAAFTAGLLHEIGILAFATVAPGEFDALSEAAAQEQCGLAEISRARLGWDHHQLAAYLARAWLLPERLCRVIEHWQRPPDCVAPGEESRLLDIVHGADALASILLPGLADLPPDQWMAVLTAGLQNFPVHAPSWARLQLSERELLEILRLAARELAQMEQTMH